MRLSKSDIQEHIDAMIHHGELTDVVNFLLDRRASSDYIVTVLRCVEENYQWINRRLELERSLKLLKEGEVEERESFLRALRGRE